MAIKIIPISEMRQRLKHVLSRVQETGEPYFITQHSRPKAVLLRYEDYNNLTEQSQAAHCHIICRQDISGGEPLVRGTRISVRHIVERSQAGQTVENILAALPHLAAAQIHAALSYYYDHQNEIDPLIEENRFDRQVTAQKLTVEKVDEGVAVARDAT